ncbi:zinc finger CCHC domain-containing protein 10-like [Leptopilina heterotoma]|uniref:zinc finger CCHC domain-containing protein 10-like n=1 Tax=Leptopilina heterotoma TaxID=63436 RepID=UPI001CA8D79A|nr:zinc finger CCHC domain-containing protein 10-like [Leptopilina heterotoma]
MDQPKKSEEASRPFIGGQGRRYFPNVPCEVPFGKFPSKFIPRLFARKNRLALKAKIQRAKKLKRYVSESSGTDDDDFYCPPSSSPVGSAMTVTSSTMGSERTRTLSSSSTSDDENNNCTKSLDGIAALKKIPDSLNLSTSSTDNDEESSSSSSCCPTCCSCSSSSSSDDETNKSS